MSDFSEEVSTFKKRFPETTNLDLIFTDINGTPRGKRIPFSMATKLTDGIYLPVSTNGLNTRGEVIEAAGLGQKLGEPDHICFPIPGSLIPSALPHTAQVMLTMQDETGQAPTYYSARNILSSLVDRLHHLNKYPVVSMELEFYLVDKKRTPKGYVTPPVNPAKGFRDQCCDVYAMDTLDDYEAFLNDVNHHAKRQGLKVTGVLGESAPAQFEINFMHHQNLLQICDQIIYMKRLIHYIAKKHGYAATFMAKPYTELAGNGLHLHMSILDSDGNNLFSDSNGKESDYFYQTITALTDFIPPSIALLCPNVNAYRRFKEGLFTPIKADWGYNHRGVALRIPKSTPDNRRIEHRIAGADANPYIVLAIIAASLLHGDSFTKSQCPEPLSENAPAFPIRMADALTALKNNQTLQEYLSKNFAQFYITCKEDELIEFEHIVTPTEIDWMLDSA